MTRRLLNLIVPDRALRLQAPASVWSFDMAMRHWFRPHLLEHLNHTSPLLRRVYDEHAEHVRLHEAFRYGR